jgi:hypothetical protein
MTDTEANLHQQITAAMQLKETDELLEIYQKQDTDEWSDQALEVVKEILIERLGSLPAVSSGKSGEAGNTEREDRDAYYNQLKVQQLLGRMIEAQERQVLVLEEMLQRNNRWTTIGTLSLGIFLGLISTIIFMYFLGSLLR